MILGSATGVAQATAGAQAAPRATVLAAPELGLSAHSVSAGRTIGATGTALRPKATYEVFSHTTRTDESSTEGTSEVVTVLARVKTNSRGKFSIRFVVPLSWRHDHLIELQKVKGADLVEQLPQWLTVTLPRPSLGLGADTVEAGSRVRVVVSGLRAHAKYVMFSRRTRENAECNCGGGSSSDGPGLRSFRTDANGRARFKFAVPDRWRDDHLIEFKKAKGEDVVGGVSAWLTVVR
ncbi:hypothetical protein [Kineosporia mesophila]|nr:hypothetical protein [Kineosporia mesophila]MCD5355071.1 hypothetical protein [Kineosporia mesophila]